MGTGCVWRWIIMSSHNSGCAFELVFSEAKIISAIANSAWMFRTARLSVRHVRWWCQQMCSLVEEVLYSCICLVRRLVPPPTCIWSSWFSGHSNRDRDTQRSRCCNTKTHQDLSVTFMVKIYIIDWLRRERTASQEGDADESVGKSGL